MSCASFQGRCAKWPQQPQSWIHRYPARVYHQKVRYRNPQHPIRNQWQVSMAPVGYEDGELAGLGKATVINGDMFQPFERLC